MRWRVLLRYVENGTASVECDNIEGGRMAAIDLLINAAEGKTVAKRSLLPVSLVERESTAV